MEVHEVLAEKSLARPWRETRYSDQDLQHYAKTYDVHHKSWYSFDVLLTVHLSIILVINQLNAQILFNNKFIIFLYMLRALLCSSSGGQNFIYSIWYHHTLKQVSGLKSVKL
jgi:hypothetical protein